MASQCVPLFLRALPDTAAQGLIRQFGLPDDVRQRVEYSLPLRTVTALSDSCASMSSDSLFGFHQAIRVARGAYGVLEFAARHSPNLKESITRLSRYSTLVNELVTIDFTPSSNGAFVLRHFVAGDDQAVGRQCNEYFVTIIIRIIREMVGEGFAPTRVGFAHAEPPETSELRTWLGCPVSFGLGVNEFEVSKQWLDQAVKGSDASLLGVLDQQAELVGGLRPRRIDHLVQRVTALLPELLPQGGSIIERAASRLYMSGRSLQRYLDREGVKFATLVETYRHTHGVRWVLEGQRPLGEVAYLLGYADVRSFVRAYRRWSQGQTPGAAREQQARRRTE